MTAVELGLRLFACAAGAFTAAFSLLSLLAAKRFQGIRGAFDPKAPGAFLPPISVLKPIKGADRELYDNLASFLSQDYPAFQVLFSLQSPDDPALEILERLRRDFPSADMEIVVSKNQIGFNPKINNLANAYPFAKYDFLMISDSDIRAGRDFLRRAAAPMADPAVGLSTCLYRSRGGPSLGAVLEALSINAHFLPEVLAAGFLLGQRFALGAAMLARREALEASGGLANLGDHLADDYILGTSIAAAGWRLVFWGDLVDSIPSFHSPAEVLAHLARWARTIRVCRPAGYLGLILLHGLPLLLLHMLLFGASRSMMIFALLVGLVRVAATAWTHQRCLGTRNFWPQLPWLPLSDCIQFGVWLLGFGSSAVIWRGEIYDVALGGRLVPRARASEAVSESAAAIGA